MFVRRKQNRSGTISVLVVDKQDGYRVVNTFGCSRDPDIINQYVREAKWWLKSQADCQLKLLPFEVPADQTIKSFVATLKNDQVHTIGPELVFGTLFDRIGFSAITDPLFRHLVIARLAYPTSKLKTVDYLARYQGTHLSVDQLYRALDRLASHYQAKLEQIAFHYTKTQLGGQVSVVFYDLTTLYYEADEEDDLRKIGYNKDGKFNQPQIIIGLLVGLKGYPIGYSLFEGNTYEGHTLIPVLKAFEAKFDLGKPIVIADAGLLTAANVSELKVQGYPYILGGKIKNESQPIKAQILTLRLNDGQSTLIKKPNGERLIISYSLKRAKKDKRNRERGLKRLLKKLKTGRLSKQHLNQRGYNKFLRLEGQVTITIDPAQIQQDEKWDGLKGYRTNATLTKQAIIANYQELWRIEKAFRISKTDLRIRPIYHRLKPRIEAHLQIAFTAYVIYKELERLLSISHVPFSPQRAAELTHTMYALTYQEPVTLMTHTSILRMDPNQQLLYDTITKS